MGDACTWSAVGSGAWNTAGNWFDLTTGTPAAAVAGAFSKRLRSADGSSSGPGFPASELWSPAMVLSG